VSGQSGRFEVKSLLDRKVPRVEYQCTLGSGFLDFQYLKIEFGLAKEF
jgi:hypothetical protein